MIPLAVKLASQQSEQPKKIIDVDMAEQIADRAAKKAAEETILKSKESDMNNYNRFQEMQNQQLQNQQSQQHQQHEMVEDSDIDIFESGTSKSISNFVKAYRGLNEIFAPPPDPTRVAIESAMSNLLSEFVTNRLGGGNSNANVITKKPSILMDVLNTAAAHGFGEQLGANLPGVIQSLTGAIGHQKTQELVDNINSKMGSNAVNRQPEQINESSNVEKQKDTVLSLDPNNSEHIKQYASAMGLTEKAAKGMLQIHQDDIINERKIFSSSNKNTNSSDSDVTQALTILIQEMSGMKETINNLQNKIVTLESGKKEVLDDEENIKIDSDSKWLDENEVPTDGTNKSVTLFQTPIKVDVDDIKGDTDSFFNEPKKVTVSTVPLKQKESVLEEVRDSKGNSTFKMSNEPDAPEVVEEVINNISDKLENNVSEVVEITEDVKKDVRKDDVKSEIPKKRILKLVNKKQEHYDINNDLINEK